MVLGNFSLHTEYTNYLNIIKDYEILCASWMDISTNRVFSADIRGAKDDKEVVRKLRDALSRADAVLTHNGDRFDLKKLNTRLIYHGLEPLPPIKTIDTLKEARKIFSFSSNKLDYLGTFLKVGNKLKHSDGMWIDILSGNKERLSEMVRYNKEDVRLLKEVFLKLRPYIKDFPRFNSPSCVCPKCKSHNLISRGFIYSLKGRKQRYQCKNCGSWTI